MSEMMRCVRCGGTGNRRGGDGDQPCVFCGGRGKHEAHKVPAAPWITQEVVEINPAVINIEAVKKLELYRCSCDDNCDEPCPKHRRENELQDRVIKAENEVRRLERLVIKDQDGAVVTQGAFNSLLARMKVMQSQLDKEGEWDADFAARQLVDDAYRMGFDIQFKQHVIEEMLRGTERER